MNQKINYEENRRLSKNFFIIFKYSQKKEHESYTKESTKIKRLKTKEQKK